MNVYRYVGWSIMAVQQTKTIFSLYWTPQAATKNIFKVGHNSQETDIKTVTDNGYRILKAKSNQSMNIMKSTEDNNEFVLKK